jgi:uncharacterized protein
MNHPVTFSISDLSTSLRDAFPGICWAFLFGSAKNGVVRNGGDLDIGVWLHDPAKRMELIPDIIGLIEKQVPGIDIDLTILNNTGSQLSMEALRGTELFIREEAMSDYSSWYAFTCRNYEYDMAWMKKQLKYRGYEVQWDH